MSHLLFRSGVFAALCGIVQLNAGPLDSPTAKAVLNDAHAQKVEWWREARVGMFIHWGLYAIPGRGEWVQWNEQIPNEEYAKLADQFRGERFDANAWADVAKAGGMKYVVFAARHHDGFALFDDPGNDYTSVATAAKRDFVADYVAAMRAAGIAVGLYYSPLDWRFPGYLMPDLQRRSAEAMRDQYHRQIDLLMSRYGPLDVLWFDGGETDWLSFGSNWKGAQLIRRPKEIHYTGGFSWGHESVYASLRKLQPQAVINGRADMPEDFHSREGDSALGRFDSSHPWELCTTIVEGPWGWCPDAKVKPLPTLLRLLVGAAGRDGNFIVNVGPRPDGQIDAPQAARIREIGDWLRHNGESIYATRGGPYLPGAYGVSTHRGRHIYLHVLKGNGGELAMPPLPAAISSVRLLHGAPVRYQATATALVLDLPAPTFDALDMILDLELFGDSANLREIPCP